MSEQLLHHPDVRASFQQVGREGMPERVERDPALDPGGLDEAASSRVQLCRVSRPPRWFRKSAARLAFDANVGRARVR